MASIIPGYEYDIFISYRQKDNRGERWVSEFVDALKDELESTFKEEISVYFDVNPHDGLLETHDVSASLMEKLKCLIFIPVISRTYCDPKSFAWEHEFKAFIEQASHDKYGLKIKLMGGNVANRVLPIRIYDLDNPDIKLCESALGGVLRGVELIYAETGVNRPLKPDDDEKLNLNKTKYRNQINKVGNAIKEIISGLEIELGAIRNEQIQYGEPPFVEVKIEGRKPDHLSTRRLSKRKLLSGIAILAILIIATILAYPMIFKRVELEKIVNNNGKITIAVMPFQNLTNDETKNILENTIQDNLITFLSKSSGDLEVIQAESIREFFQNKNFNHDASITPLVASTISKKLDANVFVIGSVQQVGSTIRLNAQITNAKTRQILNSFSIDGTAQNFGVLNDSLSVLLANFLLISIMVKEERMELQSFTSTSTNSPSALLNYIYGRKAFNNGDFEVARNWLLKAIAIDSNFLAAARLLFFAYNNDGLHAEGEKWLSKIYKNKDKLPIVQRYYVEAMNASSPSEKIKYYRQILKLNDQYPEAYEELGWVYYNLQQYDNAIVPFEKSLEIYKEFGSTAPRAAHYFGLGKVYHETGKYRKERMIYKEAEKIFPENAGLIQRQAILALTEGEKKVANEYIEKYISIRKVNSATEAEIKHGLANIYSEAGDMDKAEDNYRKALALNPKSSYLKNILSYFLIDKDRNINEGLSLVEEALGKSPENYNYLHTKGWGLYKQGKYEEALSCLLKSDSLKPEYNHQLFLHIQKVKGRLQTRNENKKL